MNLLYGENLHHKIEAIFKAFGKGAAGGGDEGRKGERGPLHQRVFVMIAIIDYGMGNLRSVTNAFRRLGAPIIDHERQEDDTGGAGAGAARRRRLRQVRGEPETATASSTSSRKQIADGKPYLGICLGMQILLESSEEAPGVEGMAVIRGRVVRFRGAMKIPHMGWNSVEIVRPSRDI